MGICQSHGEDFGVLRDIVGQELDNLTSDKKATLVAQALSIINKYRNLPETKEFPWTYQYREERHHVSPPRNILFHAVIQGNYQIALELVQTGKFDQNLLDGETYEIGYHYRFEYYLIDYLVFQLFNNTQMIKNFGEEKKEKLDIPKYFRSYRDIKLADKLGNWLVKFYAHRKLSVLTGYSTLCSFAGYQEYDGFTNNQNISMLLQSNIFTFTTIFDLPLTRQAILDMVPLPRFIFHTHVVNYNFKRTGSLDKSNFWPVTMDSTSFPFLQTTIQKIQAMGKPYLGSIFKEIYHSLPVISRVRYHEPVLKQEGNFSSDDSFFFLCRMDQIYDLKKKDDFVLKIWQHLLKKINYLQKQVSSKLLELLTDTYLARVNSIYLTGLVPHLIGKEWDPVLKQMKRMGVLISNPIYHLLLQDGSCGVAQMIIQENLHWMDHPDTLQRTSLHWGLIHREYDFVRFLLSEKANVHVIDKEGNTPFILACQMDDDSLAHQIYGVHTNKSLLNHRNSEGKIAFFYLCQKKHEGMIDIMVTNGEIPVHMIDLDLNTPLHYAVQYLDDSALMIKIIRLFSKEHLMKRNGEGKTAYQILETRTDLGNHSNVMTFWRSHQG